MKSKIVALFGMIALTLGLGLAVASPAYAVSGSIYFYNNASPTDLLEQDAASIRSQSICYQLSSYAKNKTSYIRNTSPSYWYVFNNSSCSSTPGTIYPNSEGAMNTEWNNDIESYYRAT
jgi:hypothetical protein